MCPLLHSYTDNWKLCAHLKTIYIVYIHYYQGNHVFPGLNSPIWAWCIYYIYHIFGKYHLAT